MNYQNLLLEIILLELDYRSKAMDTKFKINDEITVDSRSSTGHCRTPAYIRGKKGVIERICGRYPNPEEIALCKKDPKIVTLYRCRFKQMDVWDNYSGKDSDTIELEIYEHWLNDV